MSQCFRKDINFSTDGRLGMDDHHMLIPYTAKTAEGRWILIPHGFILDLDIQSAGELLELDQKFFMVHGFGHFQCPIRLQWPLPLEGKGNGGREVFMKPADCSFTRS
jgi:hypothetical protein